MDIFITVLVGVLTALTVSAIGYCIVKIKNVINEQGAAKKGMKALLRDRIIQIYNHYSEKKYIPIYARENVSSLQKEYKALGGNGIVDGLVERLLTMPTGGLAAEEKEE